MSNRKNKLAVQAIMAETGLPHTQARALNSLRCMGRISLDLIPSNPAVLLSWVEALEPLMRFRVSQLDPGDEGLWLESLDFPSYGIADPVPDNEVLDLLPTGEVSPKSTRRYNRVRGFASLFEHSTTLNIYKGEERVTHGRIEYFDGDTTWAKNELAVEHFMGSLPPQTPDRVAARAALENHPQFRRDYYEETRSIPFLMQLVTWLPILDCLPGWTYSSDGNFVHRAEKGSSALHVIRDTHRLSKVYPFSLEGNFALAIAGKFGTEVVELGPQPSVEDLAEAIVDAESFFF